MAGRSMGGPLGWPGIPGRAGAPRAGLRAHHDDVTRKGMPWTGGTDLQELRAHFTQLTVLPRGSA